MVSQFRKAILDIANRVLELRRAVADACTKAGRDQDSVTLLAVTKLHDSGEIVSAIECGVLDIGESRVQEATLKKPEVERILLESEMGVAGLRWHLVGHLQSNKVNKAVTIFDVIHSIDTVHLARRLGEAAEKVNRAIDCYVEVNTSGEQSKAGVAPIYAEEVAAVVADQSALRLAGLMTVGPLTSEELDIRRSFEELRGLRDQIEAVHPAWRPLGLSMGMSKDFRLAIECGSTLVRIGTAIFGNRVTALTDRSEARPA